MTMIDTTDCACSSGPTQCDECQTWAAEPIPVQHDVYLIDLSGGRCCWMSASCRECGLTYQGAFESAVAWKKLHQDAHAALVTAYWAEH